MQENSLGSDVSLKNPDRIVSSFAMQLKYAEDPSLDFSFSGSSQNSEVMPEDLDDIPDNGFKNLKNTFKELGICMMELGLRLAQVCDRAIGGKELEQSILDSCTAKGRLLHYHSSLDNLFLKDSEKTKSSIRRVTNLPVQLSIGFRESETKNKEQTLVDDLNRDTCETETRFCKTSLSKFWQQWHYDYGIFTVLTTPMFISPCHEPTQGSNYGNCMSCEQECSPPDGRTYLQLFDHNNNRILVVRSPPDSFVVQVGESADILSKGKLQSTLHSVCRPAKQDNLSRETFVVFLQPAWDKTFSISQHLKEKLISNEQCSRACDEIGVSTSDAISLHLNKKVMLSLIEEINGIVPPLSSRLKDGMTFAEFSRETTKQYYGGNGMQSKR
ncbi:hypothetical protein GIB67_002160 [Kingdonia uniflora]|uniref:Isopenicillin N synthase-like Fe(2+) 2OG dioxygenase domain-containing protein n=1 Tax=Kingdonia uniflora TaxID=39325 RepID=A0A7J7KWK5_9MAGN|nr:hypothetical protein GIB67_002160 [Kingdonia uniflora]